MYIGRWFEYVTSRRWLFTHFSGLSEHFYSQNRVGKMLGYFMNEVTSVRESISMGVTREIERLVGVTGKKKYII
jgi:ATP-binding cassette subfamily B protein